MARLGIVRSASGMSHIAIGAYLVLEILYDTLQGTAAQGLGREGRGGLFSDRGLLWRFWDLLSEHGGLGKEEGGDDDAVVAEETHRWRATLARRWLMREMVVGRKKQTRRTEDPFAAWSAFACRLRGSDVKNALMTAEKRNRENMPDPAWRHRPSTGPSENSVLCAQ